MKSNVKIKGVVTIIRENHEPIVVNNLVVNSGLIYFINRILGEDANEIGYISVGTGTAAVTSLDAGLAGGITHNENYRTLELVSPNVLLVESLLENNFTCNEISEIGLFTTNDIMIARTVLPPAQRFTKLLNENVSIVWHITIG